MRSPAEHFQDLEAVFLAKAAELEAAVRSLQQQDQTADWPTAWKQHYNHRFAQIFCQSRPLRNWAADAAAWGLLPNRHYPSAGNQLAPRDRE
ncbi:hypothetical protein [Synechococcus elongatus]|uniref:Uncharacterized protein SEF0043 n=2 Tax=Synechococcus elongatus TaxID=32046 RepID=Q8KPQ2_SYNE7|nr:hypothetical protein [Synechococcus elongatus]AAM82718.1 unknown [Synechococcus elongatus PCC 7942 = FACHB-805]ABB57215.1 conserved hypothetical protein [Synechococcus elongatus PCC 7942 = FACHB-805]AJD58272.1 hypothetical protein M744_10725 [Synechococcus elongatus UTEX 2973]MBD2587620.1 hypothetical protein [Synechococcus elongatus FACHB-242]MBD2688601.1 hypothetical protein [Synechococcus elongatus FACHB-1061]